MSGFPAITQRREGAARRRRGAGRSWVDGWADIGIRAVVPVIVAVAGPAPTGRAGNPIDELARLVSADLRSHDAQLGVRRAELAGLPTPPEDQSSARIGWHTDLRSQTGSAGMAVSVRLDLGRREAFDAVVLVPVNVAYGTLPGPGYGFPVRFRVEAADEPQFSTPVTLVDHGAHDFPNPGNLPVYLPTPGGHGRYVRIMATRLFPRGTDALLALGELMVLRGKINLAAGAVPTCSDNFWQNAPAWQVENLVDGQSVLGPPLRVTATPGNGYHAEIAGQADVEKWVQLDLGRRRPIEEIRLLAARPTDFPVRPGFGFPVRFRVEASDTADFTECTTLEEFRDTDCVNPGDNPVVIAGRGVRARFVRMTATRLWARNNDFVFALSELQVFSDGENVALAATPSAFDEIKQGRWALRYLNDGLTSQGELLDWPDWLRGLSRRREVIQEIARLETEREPLVAAALWRLGRLTLGTAAAAAMLAGWWSRRQRLARRRELARLRQRIAGDLHDEIGSNLGSIALLAGLAGEKANEGARADLTEIQRIASETTDSMRDIVWLIKPGRRDPRELPARMREIAQHQLAGAECRFETEGVTGPFPLDFERQVLLLFKEALNNIRQHARARRIGIRLTQSGPDFSLLVVDDGRGFDSAAPAGGHGLASMRHRAGLLGGTLAIHSRPGEGTRLELRTRLP